jgi:hypothetical protein
MQPKPSMTSRPLNAPSLRQAFIGLSIPYVRGLACRAAAKHANRIALRAAYRRRCRAGLTNVKIAARLMQSDTLPCTARGRGPHETRTARRRLDADIGERNVFAMLPSS